MRECSQTLREITQKLPDTDFCNTEGCPKRAALFFVWGVELSAITVIAGVKPYRIGFWGMLYEIVESNNDVIYPFVIFLNVEQEE